ncbi:MAG: cytochrome b [Chitinophagales bacterium]|nr:cytochrome b [Hyphomicrobiales bacterium]
MTESYLVLALILAFTLNSSNRWVRAGGTLLAALGLSMIAFSIVLADFDGTFSAMPPSLDAMDAYKPLILNVQAVVATIAAAFLAWAAWGQTKRGAATIPPQNTSSVFGLVSRYAHWITATLILCLVPMGLFISVLQPASAERAEFLAAHQSLGLAILFVVAFRLMWLLINPPPAPSPDLRPWERRAAHGVHIALYGLILAFPLSGFLMSAYGGDNIQFFGWPIPALVEPDSKALSIWATAHNLVLPGAFYLIIFAHIGAVLKHHFLDRRTSDVRRMLT